VSGLGGRSPGWRAPAALECVAPPAAADVFAVDPEPQWTTSGHPDRLVGRFRIARAAREFRATRHGHPPPRKVSRSRERQTRGSDPDGGGPRGQRPQPQATTAPSGFRASPRRQRRRAHCSYPSEGAAQCRPALSAALRELRKHAKARARPANHARSLRGSRLKGNLGSDAELVIDTAFSCAKSAQYGPGP
jgi:hypothetical protein